MKPILHITDEQVAPIRFVLTDIDDTLTEDGRLLEESFSSLWRLTRLGIRIIPVTGRPAGWCDCIIRQWPVEAIIGENGAFALYLEEGKVRWVRHPEAAVSGEIRGKLNSLGDTILSRVPGSRIAGDQFCRLYDLAVDFAEESPKLPLAEAEKIKAIAESCGFRAKISSIHVNIWLGDYDKLSMARYFFAKQWNILENDLKASVLYCGDSPNDEPMFGFFPLSCGVSNLTHYEHLLKTKPKFLSSEPCGRGFKEITDTIEKKLLKGPMQNQD